MPPVFFNVRDSTAPSVMESFTIIVLLATSVEGNVVTHLLTAKSVSLRDHAVLTVVLNSASPPH